MRPSPHLLDGRPLPALLERLFALEANPEDPWPWDLVLDLEPSALMATWPNVDTSRRFLRFGRNGMGSEVGFWLQGDQPLDDAPVAFLDSEGWENRVLAPNLEGFLALLALGDPDPLALGTVADDRGDDLARYHQWLKSELNLAVPEKSPEALLEQADASCPGLASWLQGGAEVPSVAEDAATPTALEELVRLERLEELATRLAQGLDASAPDVQKAVSEAIFSDKPAALRLLLERGLPVDARLGYGNTPLLEAIVYGKLELCGLLLEAGADRDASNDYGEDAASLMEELDAATRQALRALLAGR